jgi:phosphatidylserine decarboxylase
MAGFRIPVATEGWGFILVPLVLGGLALGTGRLLVAVPLLILGVFMAYFFRDPERIVSSIPGAIVAPADGRVVRIVPRVQDPFVGPAQQVSIFLSPLDVHVNRAPVGGLVVDVEHRAGAFMAAYHPEASERNERTSVSLHGNGSEGGSVVVRQIAGILARRIVCRVRPGDKLTRGERFGMIKFGSRTDLVVPATIRLTVKTGDRVRAGETVMGLPA